MKKIIKNEKGFSFIEAIFILLILTLIGFGADYVWHHHLTKSATTLVSQLPNSSNTPLLTYINKGTVKSLIVTNSQGTVLAKLQLASGKNTFSIVGNNGQSVLIREAYITSGPDSNAVYRLVGLGGNTTILSPTVSTILNSINRTNQSNEYLGSKDNLVYVSCNTSTCTLYSLDLSTGTLSSLYSQPYNGTFSETIPSIQLDGVSLQNTAYLTVDTSSNGVASNLVKYSISENKVLQSFALSTDSGSGGVSGTISPNFNYLLSANTSYQPIIINLNSGVVNTVTSVNATDLIPVDWSPDSTKVAAINNSFAATSVNKLPATLSYINIPTATAVTLKTFGDRSTNDVEVDGWSSDNQLNYTYSQTSTPNDFSISQSQYFSINTQSGKIINNPAPSGYRQISVQ